MPKPKILITDDEPGMRRVLTQLLEPEGFNIFVAEDGTQALESVRRENPDLVLLDMRLPDRDGLEILSEVKKIAPKCPVVILSGFGDVETAMGSLKQGAFDYLPKPFRLEEVKNTVFKALGSKVLNHEAEGNVSHSLTRKRKRNRYFLFLSSLLVFMAGACFFYWKGFLNRQDRFYEVTYQNPTGFAFGEDKTLWVSDWFTGRIYKHNRDRTLTLEKVYQLEDGQPSGMAWDGSHLWTTNAFEQKIYMHQLDDQLSILAEFPSPGPEPSGLFWDGEGFWVGDFQEAKFYRFEITPEGLEVLDFQDSPGPRPVGLIKMGDHFWSADAETNRIFQHATDGNLTVKKAFETDPLVTKNIFISVLGWDGDFFGLGLMNIPKFTGITPLTSKKFLSELSKPRRGSFVCFSRTLRQRC